MSNPELKKIKKIGIIAGAGYLPMHVYDACKELKIPAVVVGLENETSFELYEGNVVKQFKIHSISKIIDFLKSEGVEYVTLAGKG